VWKFLFPKAAVIPNQANQAADQKKIEKQVDQSQTLLKKEQAKIDPQSHIDGKPQPSHEKGPKDPTKKIF
jgi:hypothetical protein